MDATELSKALKGLDTGKREILTSFFMCHALCHTVEPASCLKFIKFGHFGHRNSIGMAGGGTTWCHMVPRCVANVAI